MDENVDISDSAQLVVFVRGVTEDFKMDEELSDMADMKSTTIGESIAQEVLKIVEKFRVDPKKISGLTTDGTCDSRETQWIYQEFFGSIRSTNSCGEPLHHPPKIFMHRSSECH